MAIPREFIQELVNRTDIVKIVDERVPLKKVGINFMARCPFHEEKTPSFSVSPIKQTYHCFGCQNKGNVIDFLIHYERLTFVEAIESLAHNLGLNIPRENKHSTNLSIRQDIPDYPVMLQVARYYQQALKKSPQAITYLKQRGLSGEITRHFGIGYAPAAWDNLMQVLPKHRNILLNNGLLITKHQRDYDRFRDRIMFPIRDQRGNVIAFGGRVLDPSQTPKYLNSPETALFQKSKALYGLYEILQQKKKLSRIVIVEGYLDVVSLAQHQIDYCVATLGTATNKQHLQLLFRYVDNLIFCFDGDEAGQAAAWRALTMSLPLLNDGRQIHFALLPPGEDPDSLVRRLGKEGFLEYLEQAQPLIDWLFRKNVEKYPIANMEGKAQLTHAILPLINQIPTGSYRYLTLERLSQLVRIPVDQLQALISTSETPSTPQVNFKQPKRLSTLSLVIMLLLQHPELIHTLENITSWQSLTLPGGDILAEMLNLIQAQPRMTTALILENWRNSKHFPWLQQLANYPHSVPLAGLAAEFHEGLQQLIRQDREHLIQTLLQRRANLSPSEREQLQTLIKLNKITFASKTS